MFAVAARFGQNIDYLVYINNYAFHVFYFGDVHFFSLIVTQNMLVDVLEQKVNRALNVDIVLDWLLRFR